MGTAILILLCLRNLAFGCLGVVVDGNPGVIVLNFCVAGLCAGIALLQRSS